MAKQDRAIRTRRSILEAAAKVFEERGYQAATISEILNEAGVTKGALYFHFQSKEHLALGLLDEQDEGLTVPFRPCKVQEVVDVIVLFTHRLQTSQMVRASVHLTLDQQASGLDRTGPFLAWGEMMRGLLREAQQQGELLPHVVTDETADVLVGSYAGIQAMSHALSSYQDLGQRVTTLLRHILPSVVISSVLTSVDMSAERGAHVYAEAKRNLAQAQAEAKERAASELAATAG
ncbi:ScbR family autoregulator-binding transcription factor [Streptomyces sp. NBC_00083]|uniref:ScbR family autoregulator-binding transcription factor n=1 Tax=Streptomyces sp. NBC_00083 TaxID=2975647 RepID=UPI0022569FD1|nr:ScbR family autoregulator-binding transcription factor [Streptomyces sp. NBC_00083]MCX5384338.1 ScbR family autoregulator-binding transcription factor [Streptomyces sp. NBC_00083]